MGKHSRYSFRRATAGDLDLLLKWQSKPHVREWWDTVEPGQAADFDDARVARWIVEIDHEPFAYMQDYTVHGWEGHHFSDLAKGSRGIDQFIGVPEMINIGHGSKFVAQRVDMLFGAGAPVVATDPHPSNTRAIAAYEKAGFRALRPPEETPWGLVLPMAKPR